MPDADGNFKPIAVPAIPWLHRCKCGKLLKDCKCGGNCQDCECNRGA